MTVGGDGARRYEVHCSGLITQEIRGVHQQAARQGRGRSVTRAFRQILRKLEMDPSHAGEATYRLPGLRMQVRTVVVRPIVVDFGVCEDRPLVFILRTVQSDTSIFVAAFARMRVVRGRRPAFWRMRLRGFVSLLAARGISRALSF